MLLPVTVALHTCISGGRGDLLEGWFLRTHGWMRALDRLGGITGTNARMSEVLAFTNTGMFSFANGYSVTVFA